MKRVETYVGQQVYEWLFSAQAQNEMVGLGKLSAAMLGTGVLANGLACTQTAVASMSVLIGAGELYSLQSLEATACGTLPADTTHQILKQGIQLNSYTTAALAAPLTTGQSINYLIEAQYQDSDISIDPTNGTSPVVLQYWNASNPQVPWSGPNNSGATSNTFRDGVIAYQIKAGTAAATGSQVTPTPDAGWTGLWVVSVPFAATTLTSTNISQYSAAPIMPSSLLQSIQTDNLTYGVDVSSTANVVQASYPLPVTSLTENMNLWVRFKNANTGATTFTPNPGVIAPAPVVGGSHAALQGTEIVANGRGNLVWRADITSWVLMESSGGALQVGTATQSQHAVSLGQLAVFGGVRNLKASLATAGTSLTFTADAIVVKSALNGISTLLTSYSQALSLAAGTGAGKMDTGTAPASGYVAVYATWGPGVGAGIVGQNATSAAASEQYSGANLPAGVTETQLIGVWPTNASSQFMIGLQRDRRFSWVGISALSSAITHSSLTSLSIASSVPQNAVEIMGQLQMTSSTAGSALVMSVAADANGIGQQAVSTLAGGSVGTYGNFDISILTPQTIYYLATSAAGTPSFVIYISAYSF